jgi:long-chain acyl-CoA synthetase
MYPGAFAQTTPNKPAIVMAASGRVVTYRELDDASRQLAVALQDLGLRAEDVVAVLSDNQADCLTIYWACLRSGLYLTAINHHLTAEEAAYIAGDCDATVLIASASLPDLAIEVLGATPTVTHAYAFGGPVPGFGSYHELLASAGDRALENQPRGGDMLYSSGTTGLPKGVKPPLLGIDVDEPGEPLTGLAGAAFGFTPSDVYLSPAPIYHAAPLRWCMVVHAYGGTVVMMERFDAEKALAAIQEHRVTVTQMVPTMFVRLLQLEEATRSAHDVSSLRLAIHAAAPCPPEVKQAMIDWWGPILVEYYASTEGSGLTMITSPEWLEKRGSVGRSMLGPVHICDDDGRELPPGEVGLVFFERDKQVFTYHKDPDKTAASTHPQHEFWTFFGDMGYLDEDGFLFLTDRKSFMIISGGVNIYPAEVEAALTLHPAVFDVAVIGVPDPEMGEQVKAVVQVKDGVTPTSALADELVEHVRSRIATYKAPRSVDFVDSLPRSATGKLVKRKLIDRYRAGARVRRSTQR